MENINDRISRYLSQKAGDKYIYLPYNMEFTEKAENSSAKVVMTLNSIDCDLDSEGIDFVSWTILLEVSGFARCIKLDVSDNVKKYMEKFWENRWDGQEKDIDQHIKSFLQRVQWFRKQVFPFCLSSYLERTIDAFGETLNMDHKEEGFRGYSVAQTDVSMEMAITINKVSDIGKMFHYITHVGTQINRLEITPKRPFTKGLKQDLVCKLFSDSNLPIITSNLYDLVKTANMLPLGIEFIIGSRQTECNLDSIATKRKVEEELRMKTGIDELKIPTNFSFKFVPSKFGSKFVMTLDFIDGGMHQESMAFEIWVRLLISYVIATRVELDVSDEAKQLIGRYFRQELTEEESNQEVNILIFLWKITRPEKEFSLSPALENIIANHDMSFRLKGMVVLQQPEKLNDPGKVYKKNLNNIFQYLLTAFNNMEVFYGGKRNCLPQNILYNQLRLSNNLLLRVKVQYRKVQCLPMKIANQEQSENQHKQWLRIWEIKCLGQAVINNKADYSEILFYTQYMREILVEMKSMLDAKLKANYKEEEDKVRLTASCEVKCGVIVKVEQPAESRTLNRLNQEWGL